jgi:hypothetical protein
MDYEYARFGAGFVRRKAGSSDDWMSCARDDVPADFFKGEERTQVRRDTGGDPYYNPLAEVPADAEYVGASGARIGAFRHANPAVDATAAELGLTGNELRSRLTTGQGGTGKRVSEDRFDEIANALGIDPQLARDRFADRSAEGIDLSDELNSR